MNLPGTTEPLGGLLETKALLMSQHVNQGAGKLHGTDTGTGKEETPAGDQRGFED